MSSEYIPVEIQTEILKRVPVKPLLRFRSVSKPWKCLIDSPDFIVSYGVHRPQPDDRFILRYTGYPIIETKFLSFVDNDDGFVQQEFIPNPEPIRTLTVVGSSHGLLCLKGYNYPSIRKSFPNRRGIDIAFLWNPSIRKSVVIELPDNYEFHDVIGFGVCPVTLDPTILVGLYPKIQVFTLSSGSWSILSTNLPRGSISLRCRGCPVVIDRFIHWLACNRLDAEDGRSQSHFLILSFDLTAKEFKEISITGSLSNRLRGIETLSKLQESLVILEYHREEDMSVCSLWMMTKEMGVNKSFTKLYNINMLDIQLKRLLGFRKTGEPILETGSQYKNNAKVEIYNPNSEAIDSRVIDGASDSFFMFSSMETLLLLDHLDGFIYSISN